MIEVGAKLGAWKILRDLDTQTVLCLCTACGSKVQKIRKSDLKRGKSLMCVSCSRTAKQGTTRDKKTSEVYNTWQSMIQRCHNPSNKDYKNYGARGIEVCKAWRDSFEAFYMQMGPKPTPDHTIERIDYEGDYEPSNCTWIPRAEQPLNTRSNVRLTIDGETKLVTEWARDERCPVDHFAIYKRLKRGWSAEDAVLTPSGKRRISGRAKN